MNEQLMVALRPWTYSEIGVLWSGLLSLIAACLVLHGLGRVRLAHGLMSVAGLVVTGRFLFQLATHYSMCPGCSLWFDICPNPSTWAFLYDYFVSSAILAVIAFQELRRFGDDRAWLWALGAVVFPVVMAPLVFLRIHTLEATTSPRPRGSIWPLYAVLVVVAAPFIMPALPFDHFGALGGEFFWDSTSNQANTYSGYSVMLLFGQIFLFTLPRTRHVALQVAGLFLAFNCLAAYLALFFVFYDQRYAGAVWSRGTGWKTGLVHVGALLAGNAIAAGFGVTLRYTEFVIKAPLQVCHEGLVTRDKYLPICATDLETLLPTREAGAGGNGWARRLPDETREAIDLAREAIAADEASRRDLVLVLARHHGARIPSCEEAASANYAVVNECPVTTGTASP
jgi:hypothetical protein